MSVSIDIDNVVKKYADATVINGLSLKIHPSEFFTLLGPSGCGKTTLLRMIIGFNSIEGGTIKVDDKVINNIPVNKRNMGMVFQNYAIFPHMSVFDNVAFGLRQRHVPEAEIEKSVAEILDVVKIGHLKDRMPTQLSGGQQQRVALARAIVIHPQVLLMDEPLSNLDAKLRVEMRSAIREVQKQVGITTVYVTHDQEEALAISDRIAVMKKGVIQQTASPHTIYTRPYNVFVATFIGHSNLFKGRIEEQGGGKAVVFADGFVLPMTTLSEEAKVGDDVTIAVRPEEFAICGEGQGVKCTIKTKVFLGKYITYGLEFPEDMLLPDQPAIEFSQDLGHAERVLEKGDTVYLKPNAAKVNVFTADGKKSLMEGVVENE